MREQLIAKAHCSTMRALGLIVGTMSRAHCAINHNEGNNVMSLIMSMRLIVGLKVFLSFENVSKNAWRHPYS